MTTIIRLLATITVTLLLGSSAGCGNASDDGDGSALPDAAGASSDAATGDEEDLDPEDAMLKFAQCMREHGVDMADPEPGGGVRINGKGLSEEQMESAQAACQEYMDMARPEDGGGGELTEEEKQSFLDMAACMREHGYNFPDPEFDGGRVTQKIEKGEGDQPGPEDPTFEQDRKDCEAEAGMEPPEDADGGSFDEQEG
jgi:hypothetical protein